MSFNRIFNTNIRKLTIDNNYYRHVLFTTPNGKMQLVLMSLKPGEDIGEEIHPDVNQFFRLEQGKGKVIYKKEKKEREIKDKDAVIISAGMLHNIINTGEEDLKLYSIYTPKNHPEQIIDKTKEDAMMREGYEELVFQKIIHTAFINNLEKMTLENEYFRQVIFTTDNEKMQLVLMTLQPREDIGEEIHEHVDQFFRIEQGKGKAIYGNRNKEESIKDDDVIIIPANTKHNIINTSKTETMKLYTIYTPANHPDKTIDKTKEDAEKRENH